VGDSKAEDIKEAEGEASIWESTERRVRRSHEGLGMLVDLLMQIIV
jgi:hypothetical protein